MDNNNIYTENINASYVVFLVVLYKIYNHTMKKNLLPIVTKFMAPLFLALGGCTLQKESSLNEHPNIIYVFPDQYRNMSMGFWNDKEFNDAHIKADPVHTPNLNKFAKEALVSSCAMSNCPLSSPHRGSLMTGTYPHKSGIPINCNSNRPISSLHSDISCISDIFSQSGYDCAYIGKWHADHPTRNNPQNPGQYVDSCKVVWDAYTPKEKRHHFNFWYSYGTYDVHKDPHYWDNEGLRHEPKEWSPIHEAKTVINYLQNKENQRDFSKPFFIMVGMNPPHSPYSSLNDCMEEDFQHYKDKSIDSLLIRPNADKLREKANSAKYYFSSITGVDRAFGMILNELKRLQLDKNTIVVFTSDHGETMCSHYTDEAKNLPYKEAMNVPFIIRYPNHIRPRLENLMISTPDIMPTLLGLANLQNSIPETVQGYNYAQILTESEPNVLDYPEVALYIKNIDGEKNKEGKVISYFPEGRGIKTKEYTLALFIDKNKVLREVFFFDDINDPYQQQNLSINKNKETFNSLTKLLAEELKRISDPWFKEKILSDIIPY